MKLPEFGHEKQTARCNKVEMASAPAVVNRLAVARKALLHVYAVAIGEEESSWLERLVQLAKAGGAIASFMRPETMNLRQCRGSQPAPPLSIVSSIPSALTPAPARACRRRLRGL